MITKRDIDKDRRNFRSWGLREEKIEVGGRKITYFEIPADPKGELKTFAYQFTSGNPSDGYVIGVSDSVRKDFQPLWALHEYIEYVELPGVRGRCRMALDEELSFVPDVLTGEYIPVRADFFRNLVRYTRAHPEKYSNEQVAEFSASRDRLNRIARRIK